MPDLLIFTGSDAANVDIDNIRVAKNKIILDFMVKQYHNERLTRGINEETTDFFYLRSVCRSLCTAKLSANW